VSKKTKKEKEEEEDVKSIFFQSHSQILLLKNVVKVIIHPGKKTLLVH
jgi:hypothetical protein